MLVREAKLIGKPSQYEAIDNAIRTGLFIRNACLRYWMDNRGVGKKELMRFNTTLRNNPEFPWAHRLNSHACQAHVERTWFAISRFYANCKSGKPGKKGYPRFKRLQNRASVEYKTSGWKLDDDCVYITFTDGFGAGRFKLLSSEQFYFDIWGNKHLNHIKRVRIVRRADGYYAQFCLKLVRKESAEPTSNAIGLDVGLKEFYTDSNGSKVENPRFLRQAEKRLKRLQRLASRKQKGSNNRGKANNKVGRQHLKIQRQRKDHAIKAARCVALSNDIIAYENLNIAGLVKNRSLAKSISDAGWYQFRVWLEYYAKLFDRVVVPVAPAYTSQDCSECAQRVKKSLSTRTHVCSCGCTLDRDENAARNILSKALSTGGHPGFKAWGEQNLCNLSYGAGRVSSVR